MNWSHFLRAQRPLRSLSWALIYALMSWSWLGVFGWTDHAPGSIRHFIFATVALPLVLGFLHTSALHEILHRPYFFLLPRTQAIIMRCQLLCLGVSSLISLLWLRAFDPNIPTLGALGVILAVSVLPTFRRYNPSWYGWIPLLGFVVFLASLKYGAQALREVAAAQPLALLVAGVVFSGLALRRNFSREQLRSRSMEPYNSFQTVVFNRDLLAQERNYWKTRKQQRPTKSARWGESSFDGSTLFLVRAILHVRHGSHRWGALRLLLLPFAGVVGAIVSVVVLILMLKHRLDLRELVESLAHMGQLNTGGDKDLNFARMFPMAFTPSFCLFAATFAFSGRNDVMLLPLSRLRKAKLLAGISLGQGFFTLLLPLAGLLALSLACALSLGLPVETGSLVSYSTVGLVLLPITPWLLSIGLLQKPAAKLLLGIPVMGGAAAIPVIVMSLVHSTTVLAWIGLAALCLTIAGIGFYWNRTKALFLSGDLADAKIDLVPVD